MMSAHVGAWRDITWCTAGAALRRVGGDAQLKCWLNCSDDVHKKWDLRWDLRRCDQDTMKIRSPEAQTPSRGLFSAPVFPISAESSQNTPYTLALGSNTLVRRSTTSAQPYNKCSINIPKSNLQNTRIR